MKIPTKKNLTQTVTEAIKTARKDEDNFLMISELVWAIKRGLNWDELQELRDEMTRILVNSKP